MKSKDFSSSAYITSLPGVKTILPWHNKLFCSGNNHLGIKTAGLHTKNRSFCADQGAPAILTMFMY